MSFDLFSRRKLLLDFAGGFSLGSIPLHAIAGFKLFGQNEYAFLYAAQSGCPPKESS
jgi:hypothetical protein